MRTFASSGFRLWNLSREAKIIYTFFCVFALAAIASSVAFYEDLVGPRTGGIGAYYAGEGATRAAAPPERAAGAGGGGGPEIALPDEEPGARRAAAPLTVAVTYRKLLEVTHFHLFTVPVFLLIVAHLFLLTGLRPSTKAAWIVAGWLSALAHVAAPWVVRYGGAGFAPLYAASGALFGVTSLVLTGYPVLAMWTGGHGRGATAET
jgi:hypothetical protein